jgi:ABC-2 type transport system permease protein
MLRKIWDVAAKDLLQLRKDRTALLMMFAVPLMLMAILGSAFSSFSNNGPTVSATLPVVDHDGGALAQTLVGALRQVPHLKVQLHSDEAAMKKAVRDGDQVGLLIIPKGFSAALQGPHPAARVSYYAVTNNNDVSAQFASDAVKQVVQRFAFQTVTADAVAQAQLQSSGKADPAVVSRLAAQAGRQLEAAPPVAVQTINATGRKYNAQDNTVPGYALMFALFGVTAGAGSILEEKEAGTFKRLLIAPLPPYALLGGKLLAQFIQSVVQLTVLFALGALLFKIDLGNSLPALALLIVGTAFAATGLGMILVSLIKSQRQLRPVTTLVVLAFSAVGGSWWPVAIEPQWMQNVSKISVNSWAMQGFNGLMIFGKSFAEVLPNIVALFIYGLICLAIARRLFRFQQA